MSHPDDRYPDDRSRDDRDDTAWLREQLDRELGGLTSRPEALREVLAGSRPEPAARRSRGLPPWLVAAAAVLVVALAVPLLRGAVPADRGPRTTVAAEPLLPVVTSTPSALPTVTAGPSPTATPRTSRTVAPPPRSPSVPSRSPSSTAASGSCLKSGLTAATGAPVDMDGDGQLDLVALVQGQLSVQLSASGVARTPLKVAGPFVAVLPVDSDGRPGSELLVLTRGPVGSDGSVGENGVLYAARGCTLGPVLNGQGRPYTFEVGATAGGAVQAGVTCGDGQLYGVTSTRAADGTWAVTQTPVSSASGRAVNGRPVVSTYAADDPAVASLATASCGSVTPTELD